MEITDKIEEIRNELEEESLDYIRKKREIIDIVRIQNDERVISPALQKIILEKLEDL